MNRDRDKRQRILPGVIFVAFLAALGTFFLLLNMEKNALSAYEKTNVWCAKKELPKGMEISKAGISEYFLQVEVDKNKVPDKSVLSVEELVGKQSEFEISKGTIVTNSMFTNEEQYVLGMEKPVLAGCKGEDLFQLVSGVLRKGDFVHIYTVNEEWKETYLLWENIMVYQVFDASGNVIAPEDVATPAARVNLLIEEGFAEQFYNELNNGSLRLVKVWE